MLTEAQVLAWMKTAYWPEWVKTNGIKQFTDCRDEIVKEYVQGQYTVLCGMLNSDEQFEIDGMTVVSLMQEFIDGYEQAHPVAAGEPLAEAHEGGA